MNCCIALMKQHFLIYGIGRFATDHLLDIWRDPAHFKHIILEWNRFVYDHISDTSYIVGSYVLCFYCNSHVTDVLNLIKICFLLILHLDFLNVAIWYIFHYQFRSLLHFIYLYLLYTISYYSRYCLLFFHSNLIISPLSHTHSIPFVRKYCTHISQVSGLF